MLYVFLLLFAAVFFLGSLAVAALAIVVLVWSVAWRRWWLVVVSALVLVVSAPGALWVVAVARSYGVPSWSAPGPLSERFEGPTRTLQLHRDGRYTLEAPDGVHWGRWTAEASTGDAVTSVAWTVLLTPESGGQPRSTAVRWDGVMGLDGEILRAQ